MRIKDYIIEELEKHPRGLSGGSLERNLSYLSHKPSTVSRTARMMAENKVISRRETKGYVEYCLFKFLR